MQVKQCMKQNVYSIPPEVTVGDAARIFAARHIGSLPVIDAQQKLVGLLQLRDLLDLVLPDFLKLVGDFDFVPDFGAVEARQPSSELLARPVSSLMGSPVSVEAESGLLRAIALLHKHQIHDLPVVDGKGVLVGIVSRVDAGTALVAGWGAVQEDSR